MVFDNKMLGEPFRTCKTLLLRLAMFYSMSKWVRTGIAKDKAQAASTSVIKEERRDELYIEKK